MSPSALLALLRIFLLSLLWAPVAQAADITPVDLRFTQAEFVPGDDARPPADGWAALTLPHAWRKTHPKLDGFAWYRIPFDLEAAPQESLALLVEKVAVTGEFRINGSVLNPGIRFVSPDGYAGTQMTHFSLLLTVPSGLLRQGRNELLVRVQGDPLTFGDLWPMRLAPHATLRLPFLALDIRQRVVPQALLALTLATLAFSLILWWRERRVSNLPFVVAMALWAVMLGLYLTPVPPMTRFMLALVYALTFTGFNWALLHLFWRFSGSVGRWFPRCLNGLTWAMLAVIGFVALTGFDPTLLHVVGLPAMALRGMASVMLLRWAWRTRHWRAYALTAAEMLWFAVAAQVMLMVAGILPVDMPLLGPWEGLPVFAVLLFFFVERIVLDHEQAAREQQAAIDEERRRILNDMHDGLGSHLITASRLLRRDVVDRELVARTLDEALLDLRLIIDSLDTSERDLLPLLANLRYRLSPRLEAMGIRLEWEQSVTEARIERLTPQGALNVLRIVQEAVSNAVRHAMPSTVTIGVGPADGGLAITVRDDGRGFSAAPTAAGGRGLAGMQSRATRIGATLHMDSGPGHGTSIHLWLPSGPAGAGAEA